MAYTETVMIAVVCWPKHIILLMELTFRVVELWALCLALIYCSSAWFDLTWQDSSQKRSTKILTTPPWLLLCCDAYMPKLTLICQNWPWWWGCDCYNDFFVFLLATNVCLTAWLSCDMCINWNKPPKIIWTAFEWGLSGCKRVIYKVWVRPATMGAVATRYIPGINKIVLCNNSCYYYTPSRGKIVPRNVNNYVIN